MGILVQQHFYGSTFFQRTWNEFEAGFGDVNSNYWIGNEQLHTLTSGGNYRLRVDLQGRVDCQWYWVEYSTFIVGSEIRYYQLTIGGFSGTTEDAIICNSYVPYYNLNGALFVTHDANNGGCPNYVNCAVTPYYGENCGGGFWQNCCLLALINTLNTCSGPFVGFQWDSLELLYSRLALLQH